MILTGRNEQGVYEPKVENGLGYTLASNLGFPGFINSQTPPTSTTPASPYLSLGFVDASFPKGASSPLFSVRVGICYGYNDSKGKFHAPAGTSSFQVQQGRKSYGSPGGNAATLTPSYWNDLSTTNQSNLPSLTSYCGQLDNTSYSSSLGVISYPNILAGTGCPAPGPKAGKPGQGSVATLTGVSVSIANPPPAELDPGSFYYDSATGMLFLQMQQTELNTQLPSPLGSCTGGASDPACTTHQHFYTCPANGCPLYTIRVTDYNPTGPSACAPYNSTNGESIYHPKTWDNYPTGMDSLAYVSPDPAVNGKPASISAEYPNPVGSENYPHNAPGGTGKLSCPETSPQP